MTTSISGLNQARRVGLGLVLAVALSGCVSLYRDHGYMPNPEDLAEIQVGRDTRDTVTKAIGVPTSSGVLDASGFYYVSTRFRHYGATEPRPISREVLAISFDSRGVVSNIERFGLENGRVIPLERRITDPGVDDRTFLRQLLGNLGRIGPGSLLSE